MGSLFSRAGIAGLALALLGAGVALAATTEVETQGSATYKACAFRSFGETDGPAPEDGFAAQEGDTYEFEQLCVRGTESRVLGLTQRSKTDHVSYRLEHCTYRRDGEWMTSDCTVVIARAADVPAGAIVRNDKTITVRGTGLAGCDADFVVPAGGPWSTPTAPSNAPDDQSPTPLASYDRSEGAAVGGVAISGSACGTMSTQNAGGSAETSDSSSGVTFATP